MSENSTPLAGERAGEERAFALLDARWPGVEGAWIFYHFESLWEELSAEKRGSIGRGACRWLNEAETREVRQAAAAFLERMGEARVPEGGEALLQALWEEDERCPWGTVMGALACFPSRGEEALDWLLGWYGEWVEEGGEEMELLVGVALRSIGQLIPRSSERRQREFLRLFLGRRERRVSPWEWPLLMHWEAAQQSKSFVAGLERAIEEGMVCPALASQHLPEGVVLGLLERALSGSRRGVDWGEWLGAIAQREEMRLPRPLLERLLMSSQAEVRLATIQHLAGLEGRDGLVVGAAAP